MTARGATPQRITNDTLQMTEDCLQMTEDSLQKTDDRLKTATVLNMCTARVMSREGTENYVHICQFIHYIAQPDPERQRERPYRNLNRAHFKLETLPSS